MSDAGSAGMSRAVTGRMSRGRSRVEAAAGTGVETAVDAAAETAVASDVATGAGTGVEAAAETAVASDAAIGKIGAQTGVGTGVAATAHAAEATRVSTGAATTAETAVASDVGTGKTGARTGVGTGVAATAHAAEATRVGTGVETAAAVASGTGVETAVGAAAGTGAATTAVTGVQTATGSGSGAGARTAAVTAGPGALATLARRGLVKQTTGNDPLARLLDERPVTFYLGIDPTGPSLHAGHLVGLLAMAHLQRAGHQPVLLIGGATARVGDPSDKNEMRPLLPVATVARNAALMQRQVGRFIDLERTVIVDNADWLADLGYLDFLREIGRHFSVNRMLSFEAYKRRLETGLSFLEFNYLLLQAYDFLVLQRRYGCLLQIGGDDQWANILAGVDLIRRVEQVEAHALTWPLVTTADGKKMGKTAAGALFLDPERVSPYEFYQYWINVPDADVAKLLALLTLLPDAEVEELSRLQNQATAAAKERLAMELTGMVHGTVEAERARATSRALFGGRRDRPGTGDRHASPGSRSAMPTAPLAAAELAAGIPLVELLARSSLCASKSEARRLIRQGGARVGGTACGDVDQVIGPAAAADGEIVLRAGKKRFFRFQIR